MQTEENIFPLLLEIEWLNKVIDQSIRSYLQNEGHENNWFDIEPPELSANDSPFAQQVIEWDLNIYERLLLSISIASQIKPETFDIFFGRNKIYDKPFTEFGGIMDKNQYGFLPTLQTYFFLSSYSHPQIRHHANKVIDKNNVLIKDNVIQLSSIDDHFPKHGSQICLNHSWLEYFLTGKKQHEEHSATFPAHRLITNHTWDDVILNDQVLEQVNDIHAWLQHSKTLMNDWGLYKKLKPGYKSLFYGPPGTGKTLTAALLGQSSQRDVYRIDLSMVVSKYVGETEKNLAAVFDKAENKEWILFFDEADALFGKRTSANSSNDRFANQQTGYLLQKIEDFPGIVILASNLDANIDEAFSRRFQSIIYFNMPAPAERLQLWKNAFTGTCQTHPEVDLEHIANEYPLSGGSIVNVLRFCALSVIQRGETLVREKDLLEGIRREFSKDHKTLMKTEIYP